MELTETTTRQLDGLLDKVAELIKQQTVGNATGFSTENLNHVYLCLTKGVVDEHANELLTKIIGPDWQADLIDPDAVDKEESMAKNLALTELINQIDENNPDAAVNYLASALMVACRELGWLEASRAAHDQWFYAEDVT